MIVHCPMLCREISSMGYKAVMRKAKIHIKLIMYKHSDNNNRYQVKVEEKTG